MLFNAIGVRSADAKEKMQLDFVEALGWERSSSNFYGSPQFENLPNVERITDSDLWWHWHSYVPKAWIWCGRQCNKIEIDGVSDWRDLQLFWDDRSSLAGGGYAVLWCYNQKTVHYFKWRKCAHEFKHKTIGNCLHQYTCIKCGAAHEIDSSD